MLEQELAYEVSSHWLAEDDAEGLKALITQKMGSRQICSSGSDRPLAEKANTSSIKDALCHCTLSMTSVFQNMFQACLYMFIYPHMNSDHQRICDLRCYEFTLSYFSRVVRCDKSHPAHAVSASLSRIYWLVDNLWAPCSSLKLP